MEICIMDGDFKALGIVESFSSLQWNRKYHGVGSFALTTDASHTELAKAGAYAWWNGGERTGIIENVAFDDAKITLSGSFLEKELLYRAINVSRRYSGNAEAVMRQIVSDFCIDAPGRRVPLLRLGPGKGLGGKVDVSRMGSTVLEALEEICLEQELSFFLRYDFKEHAIAFEVFEGLDRTQGQDKNAWCVFSSEFDNVLGEKYAVARESRNYLYVAGEGEGEGRAVIEIDLTGGGKRRELFVDARDLRMRDDDGKDVPMEDYLGLLRTRGMQKAAEHVTVETVEIKVAPKNTMEYALGDICTYANRAIGLVFEKRITEINTVLEARNVAENVVLGRAEMSIIDKLKRGGR